ncbi:MAG: hypothetical protein IPJ06_00150 [Saprospiraceae bacterium]|nr:hypothetical protein [Saprospiraceae bacterium]
MNVLAEGYTMMDIPGIVVSTGNEVMLNCALDELAENIGTKASMAKLSAMNEMSTVSTKTFDMDETGRYPGSRNDPARMVANYPGVRGADDSRNDIIIRGNAPFGLGWRLEDIDIPNPNHFAIFGTSGGGVNILNSQLLDRSDFYTGAFPAEFGNSIAGVFDLQIRAGNNEQHEASIETGSIHTGLSIEGPLSKRQKASYLVSYRHSTLSLTDHLFENGTLDYSHRFGVDAIPHFNDVAFKLNIPINRKSSLGVFGTGGISKITFLESQRKPCSFSFEDHGQDVNFGSKMGVMGVNYSSVLSPSTNLKLTVYSSYQGMQTDRRRIFRDTLTQNVTGTRQEYWNDSDEYDFGISCRLNKKINANHTLKTGWIAEQVNFRMTDSCREPVSGAHGSTYTVRAFAQWRYRISRDLSVNMGVNGIWFDLSRSWALDPRAGLVWNLSRKSTISAAVGIHSQIQPLYLYLQNLKNEDGTIGMYNQNIGLTRSQHYILGFDRILTINLHWKLEAYFQNITNIPVQRSPSSWSMVNEGLDFKLSFPGILQNTGTAYNYGLEWTLERTFSKQYYYLFTASVFDSKYTGSDRVIRIQMPTEITF